MKDIFYTLLGLAIIVLPIYFVVKKIKNKDKKVKEPKEKKEKVIKEKKAKTITMFATHIEGIDKLSEAKCTLKADNEILKVSTPIGEFNITLDRIINVGFLTKDEMVSKNKSVLGRAFVGSIVGLGTIGALSGIGQKVKKETQYFLVISYKAKDNEETKMIVFGLDKYDSISSHFVAQISKRISNEKLNIDL